MRIGGIEAGGTKMVCAIGEVQTDKGQPGENQVTITERVTIPTEKPKITLPRMAAFCSCTSFCAIAATRSLT